RFAPDVEGLFEAWRRCAEGDELTRNQIAWTAARAGMTPLLEELGEEIASDSEATAQLIAAAGGEQSRGARPPAAQGGGSCRAGARGGKRRRRRRVADAVVAPRRRAG